MNNNSIASIEAIGEIMPGFRRFNRRRRLAWVLATLSLFRLTCSRQLCYTHTYEDAGLYITIELLSRNFTEGRNLYNYRVYLSDSIVSDKPANYIDITIPPFYGSLTSLYFNPKEPKVVIVQSRYKRYIVDINCPNYDIKIADDIDFFNNNWYIPPQHCIRYSLNDDMDKIEVYGEDGSYCGNASIVNVSMQRRPVLIEDKKPCYIGIYYDGYQIKKSFVPLDNSDLKEFRDSVNVGKNQDYEEKN